jgi:hypothetical protein
MAFNYYLLGMTIGGTLLFGIAIWFLLRYIRKKKQSKTTNIPEDMMEIFNEAERRIKNGGEKQNGTTPYQILWEIARERNRSRPEDRRAGSEDTGTGTTDSNIPTANGNLQRNREPFKTRDFQLQSYIDAAKAERNPVEDKRKSKTNWADFS